MRTILGLILLLFIAVIGSHSLRARWKPPIFIKGFFDNGLIFLLVGVAVGPSGLNLLNQNTLERAGPIVVFCLGWIGFLFGVHFEGRRLRRIARQMWLAAMGQAVFTFLLVFVAVLLFSQIYFDLDRQLTTILAAVVTLAACASGTAPSSVFQLAGRKGFTGQIAQAMRITATVDDLPGLLAFGLLFAFFPAQYPAGTNLATGLGNVLLISLLGVLFGLLLKTLAINTRGEQVTLVVLMGVICLAAGMAELIQLSAIFIGVIAGVTFANTSGQKEAVYKQLAASEYTIYVLFLTLVGCTWAFETTYLLPLAALYLGMRTLGKVGGVALGNLIMHAPRGKSYLGGFGLLGQGGMAIALAVNYQRAYPSSITSSVTTALILGVLANQLFGPFLASIAFGRPQQKRERN